MIDTRREARHIAEEFQRYQQKVGESVVWFKFSTTSSEYNRVYDEGGRTYQPPLMVAILWVDQIEPPEQYLPEGRRGYHSLRFAVSAKTMYECGLSTLEATGHRLWDAGVVNSTWFDDRLNDLLYYDGRYWEVMNYQIRGRIREDVIVGVTCTETYIEDERIFDVHGTGDTTDPPGPEPGPPGYGNAPYGSGSYGGSV